MSIWHSLIRPRKRRKQLSSSTYGFLSTFKTVTHVEKTEVAKFSFPSHTKKNLLALIKRLAEGCLKAMLTLTPGMQQEIKSRMISFASHCCLPRSCDPQEESGRSRKIMLVVSLDHRQMSTLEKARCASF